jgi:2-polyprenylphenol hydroxylase and related flavodoxin oxidoreductases
MIPINKDVISFMSLNPRLLQRSLLLVEPVVDQATAYFYSRLFSESPHLRSMFPPAMDVSRDRLLRALMRVLSSLDGPHALAGYLDQLGRDHRKYGVIPEHYTMIGNSLLATIKRFAAPIWTSEIEAAWIAAYTVAANRMIDAADAEAGPVCWPADVVGHERRTADIAVLTLRPARHLGYQAGQYLSVQTTHWPRVWRTYSIANAPRADNTISLHVRARPGGWVSTSLVTRTHIGDRLLLGPPMGTMTSPPEDAREILAVAGGTGLAPLKAIIEDLIAAGRRPGVQLLYGARHADELYDLADLTRMATGSPWLRVLPVVSEQRGYEGMRGRLPDVVDGLGPWAEHEVFVCGPGMMVYETVRRLKRSGVPMAQIHRDIVQGEC